jgi:hypothetical protein
MYGLGIPAGNIGKIKCIYRKREQQQSFQMKDLLIDILETIETKPLKEENVTQEGFYSKLVAKKTR